ncbi:tetratricopeptide repeat protein [soil metagenome]
MRQQRFIQLLSNASRLLGAGQLDAAEAEYRKALDIDRRSPDALHFLGLIAHQRGDNERAIELMERSIRLKPNIASYHNNYGEVLRAAGRVDDAVRQFLATTRLNPNHAQAYNNLGVIYSEGKGEMRESLRWYDQAIRARPDYGRARWNRALVLLRLGDYARGFGEFEWRFRDPGLQMPARVLPQPAWDGSDPANKTILLYAEQGFGDTIQFVRYAPLVASRGATVILEVQQELNRLLKDVPGVSQVISRGEPLPPFDIHAPLMGLARLFRTTIGTIPTSPSYLSAQPELAARWQSRLSATQPASSADSSAPSSTSAKRAPSSALRVGFAWAGRPTHSRDKVRSIALPALAPLLDVPGVQLFTLQKGDAAAQLATSPWRERVIDYTSELNDFVDTAALIADLDLVVTVDTALAHLAGAMGKPTYLLVAFIPDWRWHMDREDSPWYPSLRLFRQPAAGDWPAVVQRAASELSILAKDPSTRSRA